MESNIAKLKSTHVEWSKAWRDWSFALKTMRFQLFMAMLCAPTVWKNFVIFAKLLHGCGNSSASAKLPRHPFLLLAASTLPNPGIDTKSSRGGKGQLWILKTNSWCLSCCQVTSDLFSLITSVHTQQLTGQHGESRMGSTVNRKLAASQPIQLPERFYENWHSKVGGSKKFFPLRTRSSCYLNVVSKWNTNEAETNWITYITFYRLSTQPVSISLKPGERLLRAEAKLPLNPKPLAPLSLHLLRLYQSLAALRSWSPLRRDRCGGSGERRTTCESLEPNRCDQYNFQKIKSSNSLWKSLWLVSNRHLGWPKGRSHAKWFRHPTHLPGLHCPRARCLATRCVVKGSVETKARQTSVLNDRGGQGLAPELGIGNPTAQGAPKIPSDGLGNSHLITWKSNVQRYLSRKNWSAARLFISQHRTAKNHRLQLKISKMFHRERSPSSFSRL